MGERLLWVDQDMETDRYPTTVGGATHAAMVELHDQALIAYESLACGVMVQGADATLLYANSAARAMLGLPAGLLGANTTDTCRLMVREDGLPLARRDWPTTRALRTAEAQRGVVMGIAPPGEALRWLQVDAVPSVSAAGAVQQVVATFTDITARVEAARVAEEMRYADHYAAEKRRADRLAALQHITARLSAVQTIEEATHAVLEALTAMPDIIAGIVRLLSSDGDTLELIGAHGIATDGGDFPLRQPLTVDRLFSEAVRSSRPVWLSSVEEARARSPESVRAWQAAQGMRSAAFLPLIVDTQVIGVLTVGFSATQTFAQADRTFLETLAQVTAQALDRTRLATTERAQAAQMAVLERITAMLAGTLDPDQIYRVILEQAVQLLPADCATVVLFQEDWACVAASWGTPVQPPGSRLFPLRRAGRADTPATLQAMILHDPDTDPRWTHVSLRDGEQRTRSVLSAPLVIDGREVGYWNVQSRTANRYHPGQLPLFDALTERLTLALRNAHLYAAEQEARRAAEESAQLRQEQAEQAEVMAAMSAALAGTLEPERLYAVILEQVIRVLPCNHASILLHTDGWVVHVAGLGAPSLPAGTRLFPMAGPGKPWLPTDQSGLVYLPDAQVQPGWVNVHPWLESHRVRSVIAVPLVVNAEVVGYFAVHSTSAHAYTERHLALAAALGERVSQAVRNARLYAAERARAHLAERLARTRSELMADVSHEMRMPLNAVLGYAELLRGHWASYTDAQRLERLGRILGAAERQRRLLQDLVLLNRIEGGDVVPSRAEPVAVASLARQAAEEVRITYHGQRVIVRGSESVHVHVDSMRLLQVLVNLLDNGAKYSPEGSPVRIGWRVEGATVVIRVRDHGPGITAADRDRLFVPFGRARGSRPRRGHGSTGLGLSLSRRLAESMGGSLDLESSGPEGSVFAVRLPRWMA